MMKSSELQEMIRTIVRKEIKEVVAETVNEVLAERYLKRVVSDAITETSKRFVEQRIPVQGDEEEVEFPEVLDNEDDGIYEKSPLKKESHRGFSKGFFEGTRPIPNDDAHEIIEEQSTFAASKSEPAPYKSIFERSMKLAASKKKTNLTTVEDMEKELARKRAALEVPVK